jgi:hypothetical protein
MGVKQPEGLLFQKSRVKPGGLVTVKWLPNPGNFVTACIANTRLVGQGKYM